MLLAGEAIFGVVMLDGEPDAARRNAEAMASRAEKLGLHSELRTSPNVALGLASAKLLRPSVCEIDISGMHALTAGRLVSRLHGELQAGDREARFAPWIIRGIAARGASFLSELDGTFCLALWHGSERRLTVMADPHGDAQLYYRKDAKRFTFSSSLNLLAEPREPLNRDAIAEFLRFLYVGSPQTIYERIARLEPGQRLTIGPTGLRVEESRDCVTIPRESRAQMDDSDLVLKFEELLENAIRRRVGDRRVAVFLSSGVDSATLMAGCERTNPSRVQAFTVGFDDPELDEVQAARALAKQLGVSHHELKFDLLQYREAFYRVAQGFDQPFGDPAGLPLVLACEAVKEKADVICDGTGSDGLFSSPIPRSLRFGLEVSARMPRALRRSVVALLQNGPFGEFSRHATLFDFDEPEEPFITWAGWKKKEIEELTGATVDFSNARFYRMFREQRRAGAQRVYDAIAVLPPDDSRFEAAALANVPLELPYHDADICSFVRALPERLRFENGRVKILLQRLFYRYFPVQPEPIKKRYFNIPLQSLMANADYGIIRDYLAPSVIKRHDVVDEGGTRGWIESYISGDEKLLFKVWALLVLHAWLEARI